MPQSKSYPAKAVTARGVGIGVDFGTSNSSVAIYDGSKLHCLAIPDDNAPSDLIPTATYITKDLLPLTAHRAIDQYLKDNRNRQINLKKEHVGAFDITTGFGDIDDARTITVRAHAWTDQDLPGRLFRGIKSWLGREDIDRVWVFERPFTLEALITPILEKLKSSYASHANTHACVHLGRPVNFVGTEPETNERALSRLRKACGHAEIKNPVFFPEPEAAALSFLKAHDVRNGAVYLVFDFGGGTLDLTVVRATTKGFQVLASDGIGLGGNTIDRMILAQKVFPEIGQGTPTWRNEASREDTVEFRFTEFAEGLLDWQNAYQLNTPRQRHQIRLGIDYGGDSAIRLNRLRSIVVHNLSYRLLRAVEEAKIRLSACGETFIHLPEIDLEIPFTRMDLDRVLEVPLRQIDSVVARAINRAGIAGSDLSGVVCTGGSSGLLQVRSHLEETLKAPIVVHDAFTGIAAGLAIANYHGYQPEKLSA